MVILQSQLQKQVIDIEVNNNILNGNSLTKKNILIIAAHPDDEVLGLGGTILYHMRIAMESITIDKGATHLKDEFFLRLFKHILR